MAARSALRGALLLLSLLAGACATPIHLPKDFLELTDRSDFQAVTGDDARIWIRELTDPNEASLDFWATALEHDFTKQRGYELVKKGDVKAHGATGRWFECAANVRGERIGYLVALWVSGHDLTVVEFAARAEVFAARVEAVRTALKTVRT